MYGVNVFTHVERSLPVIALVPTAHQRIRESSWVEPGAAGSPDGETPRARRSTRPEVPTTSKNRSGRPRGAVLPDNESRRPDDGEPDIWPNAVSDEVRQRVENFQAPHGYVIVPKKPRVTSLVWYAGVRVAHVDTKSEGWICLADKACASALEIREFTGAISNWIKHLEKQHQLRLERTEKIKTVKQDASNELQEAVSTNYIAPTTHHCIRESSWVEPATAGSPDRKTPRARRSTRPEVATACKNRRGRSRGSVLPDNKESRKPDDGEPDIWPNAVSNEVRQRVENFQVPHGYVVVPRKPRVTSLVWYAGVRVAHVDTKSEGWICLADEACASALEIREFTGAISNWTKHLEKQHQLRLERAENMGTVKQDASDRLEEAVSTNFFRMGQDRYRNVMQARIMVRRFQPFVLVEDKDVRHFNATMMQNDDEPTPPLSADGVKHVMLEMYAATKEQETGRLRALSDQACLPFVHLNVDKWECEASQRYFLGVRVFWVEEWKLRSANLAIKLYNPSLALDALKASDMLLRWLKGVLAEHGLKVDDIYSSTSDSGRDIKHLLSVLLPAEWAWCVPHMANRALNEGMGLNVDPATSKNKEAREEIKKVGSLVEHLNKSPKMAAKFQELCSELYGEVFKLVNDAPHRWLSLVRVLERILALFVALRTHYHQNEARPFPLKDSEAVLPQLFALVYPISDIIKESQGLSTSSTGKTLIRMSRLKTGVLNCKAGLPVTPLPSLLGGKDFVPKVVHTDHADLHQVTRASREKLSVAFFTRYYKPYWEDDAHIISDMTLALHPPFKKLKHIDDMRLTEDEGIRAGQGGATSKADVEQRRERVYDKIKEQAVAAAKKAATKAPEGQDGRKQRDLCLKESPPKRQKRETARDLRVRAQAEEFGHLQDSSSDEEASVDGTPEDDVKAEWAEYIAMKNKLDEIPFDEVLLWWANTGSKKFRWLSHVARSVYGHPATVAAIERDFSLVGQMLSPRRSRLDAVYLEIVMYLNLNLDLVPNHVPKIPMKDAFKHLPARLTEIDDLDDSIVPSLTETGGQPDTVYLNGLGAEETGE